MKKEMNALDSEGMIIIFYLLPLGVKLVRVDLVADIETQVMFLM
ncbi:Uncharacterised protein [Klebsiella pneumoniae]|nr:Uncharacterised protein [Klebsiella pneumoniae]